MRQAAAAAAATASSPPCRALTDLASVDLDECIARLYKKELLAESVIEAVCAKTKELLMRESNVVHVRAPVTVVGDIHGQFYDLIEIFKIGGWCPDTNYLFLGWSTSPSGREPADPDPQATTWTAACSASRPFPYSCA